MISVRVSEEEFAQFEIFAQQKGLSISEMVREVVLERIEEEHDRITYDEATEVFRRNPFSFSLAEVERELRLL